MVLLCIYLKQVAKVETVMCEFTISYFPQPAPEDIIYRCCTSPYSYIHTHLGTQARAGNIGAKAQQERCVCEKLEKAY